MRVFFGFERKSPSENVPENKRQAARTAIERSIFAVKEFGDFFEIRREIIFGGVNIYRPNAAPPAKARRAAALIGAAE